MSGLWRTNAKGCNQGKHSQVGSQAKHSLVVGSHAKVEGSQAKVYLVELVEAKMKCSQANHCQTKHSLVEGHQSCQTRHSQVEVEVTKWFLQHPLMEAGGER